MYERFTDRARKVMALANQEAQRFSHKHISTEHVLLGLVKEGTGVAAATLKNLDVDLRKVRLEVEKLVNSGSPVVTIGKLPLTPLVVRLINNAINEASNLNHNYVGTEHLLLGLLLDLDSVAAQILMNLGINPRNAKEGVMLLLGNDSEGVPIPELEVTVSMQKHLCKLVDEYSSATKKFGPFASKHEAIAIIREEYLELEESIFKDKPQEEIESEAIQVAAMCIRLLEDCIHN